MTAGMSHEATDVKVVNSQAHSMNLNLRTADSTHALLTAGQSGHPGHASAEKRSCTAATPLPITNKHPEHDRSLQDTFFKFPAVQVFLQTSTPTPL